MLSEMKSSFVGKPDSCSFCHGHLKEGITEFLAKTGQSIVSIKNVPAYICNSCGEAFYSPDVSRKIDKVMAEFHKGKYLAHPVAAGEVEFNKVA